MVTTHGRCPIWGVNCNIRKRGRQRIKIVEGSLRAGGSYEITREAELAVNDLNEDVKARLTSILVGQWIRGVDAPRLTIDDVLRARDGLRLTVHARSNRLLRYLVRETTEIGQVWEIFSQSKEAFFQGALAWSESTNLNELHFLADYLNTLGWIATGRKINPNLDGIYVGGLRVWRVEVPGYRQIEELDTNPDSSQCFVAMWFDRSLDEVYENGIKPAIEDAGYSPLRIDREDFIGKIDDEIIAEIRRSRFLVADATHGEDGARGGVYYEAGFAQGLGLPVIFTCHRDIIDKVHFDTRQFNHIVWENPDDLREQLTNRIGSVLGDGPNVDG